jgi:hypothetical protein
VHLYSGLLKDRQILSSETMHEYNSTFVYPRVFVHKRDVGVSTEELEFGEWKRDRIYGRDEDDGEVTRTRESQSREGTPRRRRREVLG